ncbi:MAG: Ubiquinone/menaquinone biosynthesis C-methylase UbiE [Verrucomicrobia bacterium]|nr:MAG: Ubiquinone/menaquinone biosynthesis C-methylase UbiE [Verrucomicrobiota bacterium]
MPDLPELESTLDSVRDHWDKMATATPDDCAKVDASLRAQRMRFEAFVVHHDLEGKSILDVGCGVGDLWMHLRRKGIQCDYLGVDISPEMIRRCRERFPEAAFETRNVLEWTPERSFDYIVAFGIHNVRVDSGRELLERVTRRQFELCTEGAHTSILTDRYLGFAPQIQPWRAEEILTLALDITPFVVLRHDYLPNDFSLTLYRKPLIDTRPGLLLDEP